MNPNFEYKEYKLRKPEKEDTQGFIEISSDWEVMKYYGENDGVCRNIEDANSQISWCIEQFSQNAGRWIIVEKEKNKYIGDIGFFDFDNKHKKVELGYRLKKEFWNQGIITAFIRQVINWGFNDLRYNRIQALVDDRNNNSKKVLLKNGFKYEGTLRDYEFEYDDFINLEMYSILKKDFFKV